MKGGRETKAHAHLSAGTAFPEQKVVLSPMEQDELRNWERLCIQEEPPECTAGLSDPCWMPGPLCANYGTATGRRLLMCLRAQCPFLGFLEGYAIILAKPAARALRWTSLLR